MTDDLTLGELGRRINQLHDDLRQLLGQIVIREVYESDRRAAEIRFAQLERMLAEERAARTKAIEDLEEALEKARDRRGTDWRQAVYNGLLPTAFLAVSTLVGVWLARGGP